MKFLTNPYIISGIVIGIPVSVILYFIITILFYPQIAKLKISLSKSYRLIQQNVKIEEISYDVQPIERRDQVTTGDVVASREISIHPDLSISDRSAFVDGSKYGDYFKDPFENKEYIFYKNDVYHFTEGKRGDLAYSYSNKKLRLVRAVIPLTEAFNVIIGDREEIKYADSALFQMNKTSKELTLLSEKAYYSFVRPPKVFHFNEQKKSILVYYHDSYSFAFGGDSSRPMFSTVRLYDEKYPEGVDLVEFGLKSGVIYDVSLEGNSIVCIGDPNIPLKKNEKKKNARKWKISWP